MKNLRIRAFHKDLMPEYRFDNWMTARLEEELKALGHNVEVILDRTDRGGCIYENGGQSASIPHGSVSIIEDIDTGKFHVSDFGDVCTDMFRFLQFDNLTGITCGQYNSHRIDIQIPTEYISKRDLIRPGYYPESIWQFGALNREGFAEYRKSKKLDPRLHFRGTVYPARECVYHIAQLYPQDVNFNFGRIDFNAFVQEMISHKIAFGLGMNIGGDICFRDIEVIGSGIPFLRPKLHIEMHDPLIPNVHYIAVDTELDPIYLTAKNNVQTAHDVMKRYHEVVNDDAFLEYISHNATEWYDRNIADPAIVHNLIRLASKITQ